MTSVESADIESITRKTKPVDKTIGQALKAYRLTRGMSQEKLAERLGLTFQQIQKYESGVNRIALSRLLEVGRVLGFTLAEIETQIAANADPDAGGDALTAIQAITAFEGSTRALRALSRLTPGRRRAAIEFVERLAQAESATP